MLNPNFVILAATFNLIGGASYVIATIKGKARPNRVTWFLWALIPMIAFAAQISEGVGISSLMTFMVGFGPLIVLITSFVNKNAYWQITKLDLVCGFLSLAAIGLWVITRTGNVAIVLSMAADGLAAVPTLIKAWKQPATEDYRVFMFGMISAVITLFTLKSWNFADYGFPVYILFICLLLVAVIAFPKFRPFRKSENLISTNETP